MSFFTNDAYASFRQPQSSVQTAKPQHPHQRQGHQDVAAAVAKTKANFQHETHRRADNSSFASNASTASMLSELDPLSPLNVQRAADPWHGNTLTATGTAPVSVPKVFIGDDLEDDWGDFVNGGPADQPVKASPPKTKSRRAKKREDAPVEDRAMANAGWSRLQFDQPTSLFDDDEELTEGGLLPYQYEYQTPNQTYQPPPPQPLSFARTLLTRLASFGSPAKPNAANSAAYGSGRASSFGSTPTSPTAAALLPRNYDAYDVTFEKGPIGLELETDWYGRQAVVKGFKKVNDRDGLAKTCGLIRIGDVLTAINGESCLEFGFQETLSRLRQVSAGKHTLHFKSLEAAGDLSIYNQDADIIQAKKFIHEHKEKFYRAPPQQPNNQLIHGCVERLQGEKVTAFNFHREDTGEFLLACSCVNDKTGVFVFHTLRDSHLREWKDLPMNEDSAVYLGRLVPNFVGTEFILLDHQQKRRNELGFIEYSTNVLGRVPNFLKVAFPKQPHLQSDDDIDENEGDEVVEVELRPRAVTTGSIGAMGGDKASFRTFSTTMMDRNGTISDRYKRRFQTRGLSLVERLRSFSLDDVEVDLPFGGSGGGFSTLAAAWHDDDDHAGRARAMRMKQLRTRGVGTRRNSLTPYGAVEQEDYDCDLICFETRKPSWNEELGAWTLNFQGRVKLASKKNFLIVAEQGNDAMEAEFGEDTTYLRFGKVTKSTFTLDYKAPMSPLLALAVACSSFAHKRAVT